VLLVVIFGLGAVVLGVGSGSSGFGGIADLFTGKGGSSSTSSPVDDTYKQLQKHPNNPAANRAYATALINAGRQADAVGPLETYLQAKPKDAGALSDLAQSYNAIAQSYSQELSSAQQALAQIPGSSFGVNPTSGLGQAVGQDPFSNGDLANATAQYNAALGYTFSNFQKQIDVERRIAALRPNDLYTQQTLAQDAENAGQFPDPVGDASLISQQRVQQRIDLATALAAYRRAAKLSAGQPGVQQLKKKITQLEAALKRSASG
jgi:hypothetical protein